MPMPPTKRHKRKSDDTEPTMTVAQFYRWLLSLPPDETNPRPTHQEYLSALRNS
jgi:hypothetical protein